MVDIVPNVLRNLVAGASVHTTSSLQRSLEVAFQYQRSDLAIVAGVLVVDSHRVGVVWKLKLAILRHIVVSELNKLLGNLFGGGGLIDLHREHTLADFYKKSSSILSRSDFNVFAKLLLGKVINSVNVYANTFALAIDGLSITCDETQFLCTRTHHNGNATIG